MSVTKQSQYLLTGSEDTSIIVWDLRSFNVRLRIYEHIAPVLCISSALNNSIIVSGGEDSSIIITSLANGKVVSRIITCPLRGLAWDVRRVPLNVFTMDVSGIVVWIILVPDVNECRTHPTQNADILIENNTNLKLWLLIDDTKGQLAQFVISII